MIVSLQLHSSIPPRCKNFILLFRCASEEVSYPRIRGDVVSRSGGKAGSGFAGETGLGNAFWVFSQKPLEGKGKQSPEERGKKESREASRKR